MSSPGRESTDSVIIKQGNEQRDYVTVNYRVTLKLRVKEYIALSFSFLHRQHVLPRLFLAILMYSSPDRREKTCKIQ